MSGQLAPYNPEALPARIRSKFVVADSGCWEWTAAKSGHGYGRVGFEGETRGAHRVVYELLAGPVPADLTLDHLCRVRACVNPAHLEPVTLVENCRRGDGPCARNRRKTHCPQGHAYTEDNTYRTMQRGVEGRRCKTCHKDQVLRRRERLAA